MKRHSIWQGTLLLLFCFNGGEVFSQYSRLTGQVLGQDLTTPVQYANVSLQSYSDSSCVGGITDDQGRFLVDHLNEGYYDLKISFIGYRMVELDSIKIKRGKNEIGKIELHVLNNNLDAVTVKANGSGIVYHVDRKVIQAQSFPGADVAMDLLENMPSLQVDYDGRLTYRGDGTFKVYINGHPVNNGEEKLRQLSAGEIDYIEVITNPSAKFDAEGTAGIIQVILKRNRLEGYAISTSAKASTFGSYEWLFSIDHKAERGGWYLKGQLEDYVKARNTITSNQQIILEDILSNVNSVIESKQRLENNFIQFGLNYDLTSKDYIDLSFDIDPLKRSNIYTDKGFYKEKGIVSSELVVDESYRFDSRFELYYRFIGSTLSYEHAFSKDRSHLLSAYLNYSAYLIPLTEKKVDDLIFYDGFEQKGYVGEEENQTCLDGSIAYEDKIFDKSIFEIGTNISYEYVPEITTKSGYFLGSNVVPFSKEPDEQLVEFRQKVYAFYMTFNSSIGKLDYKFGLRSEYTDRSLEYDYLVNGEWGYIPAEKEFWNFFPSVHAVCNITEDQQYSASYSRRINRPSYWSLVPISRYESPYLLFTGNGELSPSYATALEMNYLFSWNDNYFSTEVFARNTKDLVQNYYQTGKENNIIYYKQNVGDSWSVGTELMTDIDILKWWNLNFSTSLFWYQLNVDVEDKRSEEQFRTDTRLNSTFKIGNTLTLKYDVVFKSPYIMAQVEREAYWYSNLALRKTFAERKWQLHFAWSNIFNTIKYTTISQGNGFYVDTHFEKDPYVSLKIIFVLDHQD